MVIKLYYQLLKNNIDIATQDTGSFFRNYSNTHIEYICNLFFTQVKNLYDNE